VKNYKKTNNLKTECEKHPQIENKACENSDLGTPFRTHVPPIGCQHDVFLQHGGRKLPMGGPRCDLHGVCAEFAIILTFETFADQFVTQCQSIQEASLEKASHKHTLRC